ncbi:MAG TPA: DUF4142 domain-containing protein [Gemmatimonadaceae bacterium]|jgi:putative membrane protein
MRSISRSKLIVTALVGSVVFGAACKDRDNESLASATPRTAATPDSGATRVDSAAGEVSRDSSSTPVGRWLTDANALALFTTMNSAQMAAANVELQGWHSDSVRAFAESVVRNHAELQHSADSLAGRIGLVPVAPALAEEVMATMQAQNDSMRVYRGGTLDRAFLTQQVAGQGMMSTYAEQLSGVAQRPELQAFLASAAATVGAEATGARALQRGLMVADSLSAAAAADSAAKRAARRKQ